MSEEIKKLENLNGYAASVQENNQVILEKLKKHILLPEEQPLIYAILDVEKAKSNYGEFFNSAKNGDSLILYNNKAIIYRSEEDIIVNVGPVLYQGEE